MSKPDRFYFVLKLVAFIRKKKATGRPAFRYLMGACRKDRECRDRTRGNGFKLKEAIFRLDTGKKLLLWGWWGTFCSEVMRMPLPGVVEGEAGWGFEQLGLVESVPAHGRRVGTIWSLSSLPTQTFCGSMILIQPAQTKMNIKFLI